MPELSSHDFQQVSRCLAELYQPCLLKDFPDHVIYLLKKLIGSEGAMCQSFSKDGATLLATDLPARILSPVPESISLQYLYQEPLLGNLFQNNRWDAYKISDFVTGEELRRNEITYEMFYGDNDIYDAMTISIHDSPQQPDLRQLSFQENYPNNVKRFWENRPFLLTQKTLGNLFFALGKAKQTFTERDRAILNLFRPHLLAAYQNVIHYTQLQNQLAQLTHITEQFGTIILSADSYVQHMSDRAADILQGYFAIEWISQKQLPGTLHTWVKQQIQNFNATLPSKQLKPLQIQADGKQLSIRLLKDSLHEH